METYSNSKKRIDALEEQINGIIVSLNNNKFYTDADIAGCRQTDTTHTSEIQTNSEDIVETQEGLVETYEETTTSITQLEEALAEVYEIIVPPEE